MLKSLIALSILVTQAANADTRLLCTDTGDDNGSYFIDITGYEQVLHDDKESMTLPLGFKNFRSAVVKVEDLTCTKPSPFLEGPGTLMACYSDKVEDFGVSRKHFEAALVKGKSGLVVNVRGPGIPVGYSVPCQEKESR